MTLIQEVEDILTNIDDDRARIWLSNDITKMKLAISYDDWLNDTDDFFTLKEHIEYYLDNPNLVENNDPDS